VVEGGRLAGIFTERDLLRLAREAADLGSIPLAKVMTPDPETLYPDDRIALALYHMTEGGYRHIPLVDADQRPVGIVAMRDIVRFIVSMFPDTVLNVPPTRAAIQKKDGG
jgi:CBS domain-containing protein